MKLTTYYPNYLNSYTRGDLFNTLFSYATDSLNSKFYNLEETDSGYSLELELAGFKKEEVSVEIRENILTISAKSNKKQINKSFSLWDGVDSEKIEAALEDGILKINLVKKERPTKRIAIK